jgi:hypothetical protein
MQLDSKVIGKRKFIVVLAALGCLTALEALTIMKIGATAPQYIGDITIALGILFVATLSPSMYGMVRDKITPTS